MNQLFDNEYRKVQRAGWEPRCASTAVRGLARRFDLLLLWRHARRRPADKTLLHKVSYYDHRTGLVPRPTILLDKRTADAHDNPVISVDDEGHIWIFSTSHGTSRPSYVHRSARPYDVNEFVQVHPMKIEEGRRS